MFRFRSAGNFGRLTNQTTVDLDERRTGNKIFNLCYCVKSIEQWFQLFGLWLSFRFGLVILAPLRLTGRVRFGYGSCVRTSPVMMLRIKSSRSRCTTWLARILMSSGNLYRAAGFAPAARHAHLVLSQSLRIGMRSC